MMTSRIRLGFVVLSIAAGSGAAALGRLDRQTGFDSVLEMWGDLVRDVDQVAMKAAPVPMPEEIALGQRLSAALKGQWPEDAALTAYVTGVAQPLKSFVRRKEMPYHFHVVDSPEVNAFALPGGDIYVFRGLLEFVESESELASVLGHEISHVDLKHCVDKYRYELSLKRTGAGELGHMVDMSRRLATIAYSQFQEVEADAHGVRLSIDSRYDPEAALRLFARMSAAQGGGAKPGAKTPAGELARSTSRMLSDYFRSHPRSDDRTKRLEELLRNEHAKFGGTQYYVGKKNLNDHIPFFEKAFDDEWRTLR
jgi:beta-barrel assembly-enhancing protease